MTISAKTREKTNSKYLCKCEVTVYLCKPDTCTKI